VVHCPYCKQVLVGALCTCIVAADVASSLDQPSAAPAKVERAYLVPDQFHVEHEAATQFVQTYPTEQSGNQSAGLGWLAQWWPDPPKHPNRAVLDIQPSFVPGPLVQVPPGVPRQVVPQPLPTPNRSVAVLAPASSFGF
jgi:hypothetical protein